MEAYKRLIGHWQSVGYAAPPGIPRDAVRAFELTYGLKLPEDFRDYLFNLGQGTSGYMPGSGLVAFWSMDQILSTLKEYTSKPVPNVRDQENSGFGIPFADFLINSHYYAVSTDAKTWGEIFIDAGREQEMTAKSFTEFIEFYIRGDYDI